MVLFSLPVSCSSTGSNSPSAHESLFQFALEFVELFMCGGLILLQFENTVVVVVCVIAIFEISFGRMSSAC